MLNYATAEMLVKKTLDSAFSKNAATRAKRVAFANACLRRVPLSSADNVRLLIWASDYAAKWQRA